MSASSLTIILDAGPLVAVCNSRDPHHVWAAHEVFGRRGGFIVTSAAVAEATHLVRNYRPALARQSGLASTETALEFQFTSEGLSGTFGA